MRKPANAFWRAVPDTGWFSTPARLPSRLWPGLISLLFSIGMEFAGSRPSEPVPGAELPGRVNYILGNNPRKWRLGIPVYDRVAYREIYPGINVVYYGNQQQLRIRPGVETGCRSAGDSHEVLRHAGNFRGRKRGSGAEDVRRGNPSGTAANLSENQRIEEEYSGRYVLGRGNEVGFLVSEYDPGKPLVIDPAIAYAALFGGMAIRSARLWQSIRRATFFCRIH